MTPAEPQHPHAGPEQGARPQPTDEVAPALATFSARLEATVPRASKQFQSDLLHRLTQAQPTPSVQTATTNGRVSPAAHAHLPKTGAGRLLAAVGVRGALTVAQGRQGRQGRPYRRAASLAWSLAGAALLVGLFVGMALLLKSRQEAGRTGLDKPGALAPSTLANSANVVSALSPQRTLKTGPLSHMAWSPDGRSIAGAQVVKSEYLEGYIGNNRPDNTYKLQFWDAQMGNLLNSVELHNIMSIAWSPDSSMLALGLQKNTIKVYRRDGRELYTLSTPSQPPKSGDGVIQVTDEVRSLAWSPDSRLLAAAADEPYTPDPISNDGVVRLWDMTNGTLWRNLKVTSAFMATPAASGVLLSSAWAFYVAWSPDGTLLAIGSAGPSISLWNTAAWQMERKIQGSANAYLGRPAWSPDSRVLTTIAGQSGEFVELYDSLTGGLLRRLPEAFSPLTVPTSAPGIPVSQDEVQATAEATNANMGSFIETTVWSPDGHTLLTSDGSHIRLWDAQTGKRLQSTIIPSDLVAWSPDGRVIAAMQAGKAEGLPGDGQTVTLLDPATGKTFRTVNEGAAFNVAWSPDGGTLAVSTAEGVVFYVAGDPAHMTPTATATHTLTRGYTPTRTPFPPTPANPGNPVSTVTAPPSSATPSPTWTPGCSSWLAMESPNADANNRLLAIAGVNKGDLWVVGYHSIGSPSYMDGTPVPDIDKALILRGTGVGWRVTAAPNAGGPLTHNQLLAVSSISADDVWAVGFYGDLPGGPSATGSHTLTEHWDGKAWSIVPAPDAGSLVNQLTSVVALAPDNVWAGGYYDESFSEPNHLIRGISKTLMLHWDGRRWARVETPNPGPYRSAIYAMSAAGTPGDVWAVGEYSSSGPLSGATGYTTKPLALHWDGKAWSSIPTPALDSHYGFFAQLTGVTADNEGHVWAVGAVGSEGNSEAIMLRWDGKEWKEVAIPVPLPAVKDAPRHDSLSSVSAGMPNDVWAVGSYAVQSESGNSAHTMALHWNGTTWTLAATPDPHVTFLDKNTAQPPNIEDNLAGVIALPGGIVWAVGSSSYNSYGGADSLTLLWGACP